MLIDSHAHLTMFADKTEQRVVIQRAETAGVKTILTIGTTLPDSRLNLELACQFPQVYATVGVHPHDLKETPLEQLDAELRTLAANPRVLGIGEIGLDYHYQFAPIDMQQAYFRRQLQLAKELRLPVIIHDREAHADVLRILAEVDVSAIGGVMHCFSGDLAMAERVRELGLAISLAGPLTFKKPGALPEIAVKLPLSALLVETDCPYLAPVPLRGKQNEPAYVTYIAQKLAELRGMSVAAVAAATSENFWHVFHAPQGE